MQHQSITLESGTIIPAPVDQQIDLALLPACIDAYPTLAGGTVALATVQAVIEAMRDGNAVIALYTDGECETAARCLWPSSVSVTKDKNLVARACYSLRKEWRTFRLDRMVAVHPLSTPDDAEPQARAEPLAVDLAQVAVSVGRALVTLAQNVTLDTAGTALLNNAVDDLRRLYDLVATA